MKPDCRRFESGHMLTDSDELPDDELFEFDVDQYFGIDQPEKPVQTAHSDDLP